jgi:hypothetical protein
MALIWRVASQAAKESMRNRIPIDEILRATGTGWEIPTGVEPPEDATAKELASWVREVARPCAS